MLGLYPCVVPNRSFCLPFKRAVLPQGAAGFPGGRGPPGPPGNNVSASQWLSSPPHGELTDDEKPPRSWL